MRRPTDADLAQTFDALVDCKDVDWGDVQATEEWANLVELMNRLRARAAWKGLEIE